MNELSEVTQRRNANLIKTLGLRFFVSLFALFLITEGHANDLTDEDSSVIDSAVDRALLVEKLLDAGLISNRIYERQLDVLSATGTNRVQPHTTVASARGDSGDGQRSRYIALVIGSNDYTGFEPLETAVNDAVAIGDILDTEFGFDVRVVLNPTRRELVSNIRSYRDILQPDDQFLLYYAGHGYLDERTQRGYWLPIDAEFSNSENWISNVEITSQIRNYMAENILVIADACFSGSLAAPGKFSTDPASDSKSEPVRSRIVISSGGLEPVLDNGFGNHSIFAQSLLKELSEFDNSLTLSMLFRRIRDSVARKADQEPKLSVLQSAGHEGGSFQLRRDNST